MTDEKRTQIIDLHERGYGVNEIARMLEVWPNSVRWALNRAHLLSKERDKRKASGASDYKCGICGEAGHNRKSHGVER